ncbi:MAG TPA: carbamoyltransferase HypF, partial [Aliiroseovarius sp.]|nr:carbamoyltransferase HypF [Aliiroseovarius sp.]
VRGLVQGVGFRPHVWHLARQAGLSGEVLNDAEGVLIRLAATREAAEALAAALRESAPPLARIDAAEIAPCARPEGAGFRIVASRAGAPRAAVTPDAATCPDCLGEIADPANRRFAYAFTNCTNCGPRLSITRAVPYDRANTSMAAFEMCPACRGEYENPADRRFHAQPNACPDCGPRLWLRAPDGAAMPGEALEEAARLIRAGRIVAIKGLGGWQLAVDATDEAAVSRLRALKRRPHKPLALMAAGLDDIRRYCHVSAAEAQALASPAAPITLLRRRTGGAALPEALAPGIGRLGFMLAATPLHHLLMARLEGPIVLTSGNASGDPQITDDEEARALLGRVADAFLGHDRAVVHRVDDSVVQMTALGPQVLRHGRGLAPAPLILDPGFGDLPAVLAMGGDIKNAFCLLGEGRAMLSPHIGDLATARARRDLARRLSFLRDLFGARPARVAVDAHPGYFASRMGRETAAAEGLELVEVQHHHAHIAATMAAAGLSPDAPPVLGIVLDGLGWGTDGTIWGGEFLRADFSSFTRLACFAPVPMPGGDAASREPWRNLLAHLHHAFGAEETARLIADGGGPGLSRLSEKPCKPVLQMIKKGLNAPLASSAGRLFDAVAAALGLCFDGLSHEGQAAMQLQALAERAPDDGVGGYPLTLGEVLDWKLLWQAIIADLRRGDRREVVAARFHRGLAAAVAGTAARLARDHGLASVVPCGGVFQNEYFLARVVSELKKRGLDIIHAPQVPVNDGGLALGQAAIGCCSAP